MSERSYSVGGGQTTSVGYDNVVKLPKGGSGSGGSGMDARLVKLETNMDHVKTDMSDVKTRLRSVEMSLATLTERVSHLPSKGFIFTTAVGIVAALSAALLFAEKLRALFGV